MTLWNIITPQSVSPPCRIVTSDTPTLKTLAPGMAATGSSTQVKLLSWKNSLMAFSEISTPTTEWPMSASLGNTHKEENKTSVNCWKMLPLQWWSFLFFSYHFISTAFPHRGKKKRTPVRPAVTRPIWLSSILLETHTHTIDTTNAAQVTGIPIKSWLFYLCTCCWWKPMRPSCQRPSHSPRSITRSACGASMLLTFDGERQLVGDKKQSTRRQHEE